MQIFRDHGRIWSRNLAVPLTEKNPIISGCKLGFES